MVCISAVCISAVRVVELVRLVGDLGDVVVLLALGQVELMPSDVGVEQHVSDVQKRRLVLPDVDKGRLHSREHPGHASLVDVADDSFVLLSLEVKLSDVAVLDQRDPGLSPGRVDHEDAAHKSILSADLHPGRPTDGTRGTSGRAARGR